MHAHSASTHIYFILQVFASPIAIIYNTPGVEGLVLSRGLVESILVGRTTLWFDL